MSKERPGAVIFENVKGFKRKFPVIIRDVIIVKENEMHYILVYLNSAILLIHQVDTK